MRIFATLATFIVLGTMPVLAQGGSTGGSLGKHDQSLSGGGDTKREPVRKKSGAPSSGVSGKIFDNPRINGIAVDQCLSWASQCGEPSATAWCQSKGLKRAVTWNMVLMSKTYIQSNGALCEFAGLCGGFTRITCE